jgi:hypothetical protein
MAVQGTSWEVTWAGVGAQAAQGLLPGKAILVLVLLPSRSKL